MARTHLSGSVGGMSWSERAARFLVVSVLFTLVEPPAVAAPTPARGPVAPTAPTVESAGWEATLQRVSQSVVSIRMSVPRAFDTEGPNTLVATGFVVDAEHGILLTNRHVVQPGPVVAEATFLDHEEVPLTAIYRDPVHDFGFYRFDPHALKHQSVVALPLVPDAARVGVDIRVIGNDAGEKISFLPGILARLDRDAPAYGRGYNDFNTFYYQAASGTSGGSSGSPVVDEKGRVIALNAGGRRDAASSYYLPLDRVVRALGLVQAGAPVPRGTWQAVLTYEPYDELRRLGLRADTESAVRAAFPDGTGMLVVDEPLPGGPARDLLQPGDIVVRIDGQLVTTFIPWESLMDDRVGRSIEVQVERGGRPVTVAVPVQDLHAITPSSYLEVGGGVLNTLSFQVARSYGVAAKGVYVADGGSLLAAAGVPDGAVIVAAGGKEVTDIEGLEAVLAAVPEAGPVQLRYQLLGDRSTNRVATAYISRRWFPMQRCVRDDTTGEWPCVAAPNPPAPPPAVPVDAHVLEADKGPGTILAPSLVWVTFEAPTRPEGLYGDRFIGSGVVVDAERGLVVTDRDTVPIAAGQVRLTFAGSVEVPAEVVAVSPFHNVAVVRYDPKRLGATPVRAVTFSHHPLEEGDNAWLVGLSRDLEVISRRTTVSRLTLIQSALPDPPYFRDTNVEVAELADGSRGVGGVVANRKGEVQALWASFIDPSKNPWGSFHRGLPASVVEDVLAPVVAGAPLRWPTLGAELDTVTLAEARGLGLPAEEAEKLEAHGGRHRQALQVRRVTAGSGAAAALRGGDLLLTVGGAPVVNTGEVEAATRDADAVDLTLLRDGKVVSVHVPTFAADGVGVDRMVVWAGALLHTTPLTAQTQRAVKAGGVYVSWIYNGSPAQAHQLWPTRRIIAIDDAPITDLDSLLAAVSGRRDRSSVRVRTVGLDGRESVLTLKLDLRYWPTSELVRTDSGWERRGR